MQHLDAVNLKAFGLLACIFDRLLEKKQLGGQKAFLDLLFPPAPLHARLPA